MRGLLVVGILGLISLAGLVLVVWAVVDMAGRSEAEFEAIGSNRTVWLVGTIVLTLACGVGVIPALVYLLSVRPRLQAR
jgi:hypothetical protein